MLAMQPKHLLQFLQEAALAPGQPQTPLELPGMGIHALQWQAEAALGAPE
jgi:hypothetical protein